MQRKRCSRGHASHASLHCVASAFPILSDALRSPHAVNGSSIPLVENFPEIRSDLLADYIKGKKQAYTLLLQQEAELSLRRQREAQELVEEQVVDSVLGDSARIDPSTYDCNEDPEHQQDQADQPKQALESGTRLIGIAPLVLDANTLLELLPPLCLPVTKFTSRTGNTDFCQDSTGIPPYYPYLTTRTLQPDQQWKTQNSADDFFDSSDENRDRGSSQASWTGVVAFHSSGYGAGWADFRACNDWVCLPKRSRS